MAETAIILALKAKALAAFLSFLLGFNPALTAAWLSFNSSLLACRTSSFIFFYSGDFFDKKTVILPHFTSIYLILSQFTSINLILPKSIYLILLYFTTFYLILPHFTSFDLFQKKTHYLHTFCSKNFKAVGLRLRYYISFNL